MKAKKLIFAMAATMAIGSFVSCEETSTAEEDNLYEQSIDKAEVKNEDSKTFQIEIENRDLQAIDKAEVRNEDS
ncbi:hypothetical protein [Maribacter luteus]|uniref:hypothetical protein n=1 Tax=Maribacter luteus TaxID=2594478 RepID=UPI002493A7E2|nr:hypothetical protein [Maribacter luteus]|tara:strand:+ start:440 stop:661 length:222 start_codon:yes stop_codon:yes gene_type:complete